MNTKMTWAKLEQNDARLTIAPGSADFTGYQQCDEVVLWRSGCPNHSVLSPVGRRSWSS